MKSNYIVGSGFISRHFQKTLNIIKKYNVIIYAAGISNSNLKNKNSFKKDLNKLKKLNDIFLKKKIIYFSSCSVKDKSRKKKLYFLNKIKMENYIKTNFKNYLILRLPEVVGKSDNKNTLVNFFYNKIINNKKIYLLKNAYRNLIDIDDVVKITIYIIKKRFNKKTINIANTQMYPIIDIINNLERVAKKKAIYQFLDKGDKKFNVNCKNIKSSIKKLKINFNKFYLYKILKKYY